MTDNTDLITELRTVARIQYIGTSTAELLNAAADALAARDAACGHLPNDPRRPAAGDGPG